MLFKGNSSRLELLIGKIQAHKEPSQEEQHKSKGIVPLLYYILILNISTFIFIFFFFTRAGNNLATKLHDFLL